MTTDATRAFLPTLRRLEGELTIPLPDQVSVLQELESDLEELTESFVARGHGLEDARGLALDALVPDGTALGELRRIHSSTYARISQRFGGSRLRVLERTALVVTTTGVMVIEALALTRVDLRSDPSPFMWPVLWLSGLLFAAIVTKSFSLLIKKDHGAVGHGTGGILVLSALVLAGGLAGVTVDLYVLAGQLEAAPESTAMLSLQWLRRDGALLAVSMLASIAGGLTWFVLTQWLATLGAARAEALGLRPGDTLNKGR